MRTGTAAALLVSAFLFTPVATGWAAWGEAEDDSEPPVAGQPADFDGAVGSYKIKTEARPTTLQAEDTLLLTARIIGSGPAGRLPRRPNLRRLPDFKRQFAIEDLPDRDRYLAGEHTWEFHYRLRPKSLMPPVKQIPAVPFVFFKPHLIPPELGYQTDYSRPIALQLIPRAIVQAQPAPMPDQVYELMEGPELLRNDRALPSPGPAAVLLLLLAPPALCAGWYITWRRLYPDAARLAHRRRSRAARQALEALHAATNEDGAPKTTAAVLANYLRQRADLTAAEPTAAEVADHLQRSGFSSLLAARVAEYFRKCDAARFGPEPLRSGTDFVPAAVELILALEADREVGE